MGLCRTLREIIHVSLSRRQIVRTVQEPPLSHHDQWRLACDLSAPGTATAEEEEGDIRFGKRWYMTVIALLYIGRLRGFILLTIYLSLHRQG